MGGQQSTRRITVVNDEASGVIKISDSVVNRLKEEIEGGGSKQQQKPNPQASVPANEEPPPPPPPSPPVEAPPPPPPPPVETPPSPPPPPVETPPLPPPPPVETPPPSAPEPPPAPPPIEMTKAEPTMPSKPEENNIPIQQNIQPAEPPSVAQEVRPQRPVIQYIEEPSLSSLKIRAEKEKELNDLNNHWKKRMQGNEQEKSTISNIQTASMALSVKELEDLIDYKPVVPICQDQRNLITQCLQQNKGQPLKCGNYVKEFSNCVNSARLSFAGRAG